MPDTTRSSPRVQTSADLPALRIGDDGERKALTVRVAAANEQSSASPTWRFPDSLDSVGNELRAFVNGTQVQATDTSHPSGQDGLVMYKAGVEYVDYLAWQP